MARFSDVAQRTLLLFDEVSRKRELFEKEQRGPTTGSGGSRQVHLSQNACQPHTIIHAALVIKS